VALYGNGHPLTVVKQVFVPGGYLLIGCNWCASLSPGDPPAAVRDLVEVTRRAQGAAMQLCGPDVPFSAIGACIQKIADAEGMLSCSNSTAPAAGCQPLFSSLQALLPV